MEKLLKALLIGSAATFGCMPGCNLNPQGEDPALLDAINNGPPPMNATGGAFDGMSAGGDGPVINGPPGMGGAAAGGASPAAGGAGGVATGGAGGALGEGGANVGGGGAERSGDAGVDSEPDAGPPMDAGADAGPDDAQEVNEP